VLIYGSDAQRGPGGPPIHREHRRSQGGQMGYDLPRFLENIFILCFEKRFSEQNSVICLKSNILAPPNFWAGYATDREFHTSLIKRSL